MYKLYTKGPNLKTREQRLEWALYRVVEAVEQQRGALEYALQVLNENGDVLQQAVEKRLRARE